MGIIFIILRINRKKTKTNLKNVEAEHANKFIVTVTDKEQTLFPDVWLTTKLGQHRLYNIQPFINRLCYYGPVSLNIGPPAYILDCRVTDKEQTLFPDVWLTTKLGQHRLYSTQPFISRLCYYGPVSLNIGPPAYISDCRVTDKDQTLFPDRDGKFLPTAV